MTLQFDHALHKSCDKPRRPSLRFVPYKDMRAVARDLKTIYTAVDHDHAWDQPERFAETWDPKYLMISAAWTEHWERIVPFLAFPPDVRRAVYTTNTIEALNRQIRKIIKTRGSFPTEDSARHSPSGRAQSRLHGFDSDRRLAVKAV
jgi:transposase-like protein